MTHDALEICNADFGRPIILHTDGGDVETVGIFDAAFLESQMGEKDMDPTSKRLTKVEEPSDALRGDVREIKTRIHGVARHAGGLPEGVAARMIETNQGAQE